MMAVESLASGVEAPGGLLGWRSMRQSLIGRLGLVGLDALVLIKVTLVWLLLVSLLHLVSHMIAWTVDYQAVLASRTNYHQMLPGLWSAFAPALWLVFGLAAALEDREKGTWWIYGTLPVTGLRHGYQRFCAGLIAVAAFLAVMLGFAVLHDLVGRLVTDRPFLDILPAVATAAREASLSDWFYQIFRVAAFVAVGITVGVLVQSALASIALSICVGMAVVAAQAAAETQTEATLIFILVLLLMAVLYPGGLRRRIRFGGGAAGDNFWSEAFPVLQLGFGGAQVHEGGKVVGANDAFRRPSPALHLTWVMVLAYLASWVPSVLLAMIAVGRDSYRNLDMVVLVVVQAVAAGLFLGGVWPDREGLFIQEQTRATLPVRERRWFWLRFVQGLPVVLLSLLVTIGLSWQVNSGGPGEPVWFLPPIFYVVTLSIMACLSHFDYTRVAAGGITVSYLFAMWVLLGFLGQGERGWGEMVITLLWVACSAVLLGLLVTYVAVVHSPVPRLAANQRVRLVVVVGALLLPYLVLLAGMPPWQLFLLIWPL